MKKASVFILLSSVLLMTACVATSGSRELPPEGQDFVEEWAKLVELRAGIMEPETELRWSAEVTDVDYVNDEYKFPLQPDFQSAYCANVYMNAPTTTGEEAIIPMIVGIQNGAWNIVKVGVTDLCESLKSE